MDSASVLPHHPSFDDQRFEEAAHRAIVQFGPLEAFRRLIAANDAQIRSPDLLNGREVTRARTAIYTSLARHWAEETHLASGYDRPFAVAALGGTGRGEMTPFSDTDFAFLFDDAIEDNRFLLDLQRQTHHSTAFRDRFGFSLQAFPFNLDDLPSLEARQLNSFLDLKPIYDPDGLAPLFRERLRATFDPFGHFLHVRGFWKDRWEKAAAECERLDCFDIKNDGLRVFLAGIWTLAGKRFLHSHEVYRTLDDPRDLEAYEFLLRIRAFIHSRCSGKSRPLGGGNHAEDILRFGEFTSFDELLPPETGDLERLEFANAVRARLLSARRRVARFAKAVIERELRNGREVAPRSPIVYGTGGLFHTRASLCTTPRDKSRAALALLLASQHYEVPVDPAELQTTFRGAGDWLVPVPELAALFHEPRGSLAESLAFLSQLDGAEDRLFPGYASFEVSLDARVMQERLSLRGALVQEKLRYLEEKVRAGRERLAGHLGHIPAAAGVSLPVESALLDVEHLTAVKLALKTKRLPLTEEDLRVRADARRPLHERFATGLSDIPLSEYYRPFQAEGGFSEGTLRCTEFLVAHRRAFKERAQTGINDARQVEEFARLFPDEHLLRALFVFTCADRANWESESEDPTRWFNTRELYAKTFARFRPTSKRAQSLAAAGYSPDQLRILQDFGDDFFGGVYRQYADRFGSQLVRLAEEPETAGPRAVLLQNGASKILGVAARDYRGLAASVSGALWRQGVAIRQVHLFSAGRQGLALDFFHISPPDSGFAPHLTETIEQALRDRLHIAESDEASLPRVAGTATLSEWRPGLFRLRFETEAEESGLIYALTYKIYRYLGGNIFGLTAYAARDRAFVSVYHSLPAGLSLETAQTLAAHF